jgi:hypothetical protein
MNKHADASPEAAARWARTEGQHAVTLRGKVVSGRREATVNMQKNVGEIQRKLGASLVEGSLNIILSRPLLLRGDTAVETRFTPAAPLQLEWPGRLNGQEVWLHRWHNAPLHIVEALSTVHLRERLNLADGDSVRVKVRKSDIAGVPVVGRLAWMLFWFGRTGWTYTHDVYVESAQRWCTEYGATQAGTEKKCRDLAIALSRRATKSIPGIRSIGFDFGKFH